MDKSLWEKVKELLNSIRFWQLTLAMFAVLAAHYFPQLEFFFTTVAAYLATVVGIGSLDSFAVKVSSKKEE